MSKILFNKTCLELIDILIKNGNQSMHGRGFARELKANQKTVQKYLDLLEKEKIMVKTIIGKSHTYSIADNLSARSFLICAEAALTIDLVQKEFELCEIISDIKQFTKKPVLIFGSYAKGYYKKQSDIDILILDEKTIQDISHKYTKEISIRQMNKNKFKDTGNFFKEVLRNHRIICGYEMFIDLWWKYA